MVNTFIKEESGLASSWSSCCCCFFCYKSSTTTGGEGEVVEEEEEEEVIRREKRGELTRRFLTLFGRHVQIGEKTGGFGFLFQELYLLAPCEDCAELLDSFCGLYGELKRAEMRLDERLSQLEGVMRAADDGVPERVQHFMESIHSHHDDGVAEEENHQVLKEQVVGTRKLFIENCKRRLDTRFPKVILKRAGAPPGGGGTNNTIREALLLDSVNLEESSTSPSTPSTPSTLTKKRKLLLKAKKGARRRTNSARKSVNKPPPPEVVTVLSSTNSIIPSTTTGGGMQIKVEQTLDMADDKMSGRRGSSDCEGGGSGRGGGGGGGTVVVESYSSSGDEFEPSSSMKMETGNDDDEFALLSGAEADDDILVPEHHHDPSNTKPGKNKCSTSGNNNLLEKSSRGRYFYYFCKVCEKGEMPSHSSQQKPKQKYKSLRQIRHHLETDHGLDPTETKGPKAQAHYSRECMSKEDIQRFQQDYAPSTISPSKKLDHYEVFPCSAESESTCPARFLHLTPLQNHLTYHGRFSCHECDVIMGSAIQLALHELTHNENEALSSSTGTGADPKVYNCRRCEESQSSKSEYLRHHLGLHLDLPTVTGMCPICDHSVSGFDERFESSLTEIRRHMKLFHDVSGMMKMSPPQDIPTCSLCPAYFKTEKQLVAHKSKAHSIAPPPRQRVQCPDCSKSFKDGWKMRRHRYDTHLKNAEEDRPFACSIVEDCSKRFESAIDLANHQRHMHTERNLRVLCPTCGELCWNSTIGTHMLSHRRGPGEVKRSEAPVVCDQCGISVKAKHLKGHLEIHKGPSGWKHGCPVCGKRFYSSGFLTQHLRTHSNAKPFVCGDCGEAYAHPRSLRHHVSRKHNSDGVEVEVKKKARKVKKVNKVAARRKKKTVKSKTGVNVEEEEMEEPVFDTDVKLEVVESLTK